MARPKMHGEDIYKTTLYLSRDDMKAMRRLWAGYDTSTVIRDLMRRAIKARAERLQTSVEPAPQDPDNVMFQV